MSDLAQTPMQLTNNSFTRIFVIEIFRFQFRQLLVDDLLKSSTIEHGAKR